MQRLIRILALAALVAGCGGGQSKAESGARSDGDPDPTDRGTTDAAAPSPDSPLTDEECQAFLDHVIVLMVEEHNHQLRQTHAAAQAKRAKQATASGQPAPKPEPFDERTLWTDEDAAKARKKFADQYLKQCLKMPRASLECAMKATTAADMRQC